MKNLEKNKNIYIKHGRFYIDFQKNGMRIRRATGLKKSALAFEFVRKNYDLFIGSKADIEKAQHKYYELEDLHTDRMLWQSEQGLKTARIKNLSEFSFDSVIDRLLSEKSFLKNNTIKLYNTMADFVVDFLSAKSIFYLADFKRYHSIDFIRFCKNKGLKDSSADIAHFLK